MCLYRSLCVQIKQLPLACPDHLNPMSPTIRTDPLPTAGRDYIALGLEGSANKLGIGIVKHAANTGQAEILSNPRHTYVTPPGEGFQPTDTAKHHKDWILKVIKDALEQANVSFEQLDCICFTKGPSNQVFCEDRLNAGQALVWEHPYRQSLSSLERFHSCTRNL